MAGKHPSRRSRGRSALVAALIALPSAAAAVAAACNPESSGKNGGKQRLDATFLTPSEASVRDADDPEAEAEESISDEERAKLARGKYLVDDVAGCGDCHTPGGDNPDPRRYLAGVDCMLEDTTHAVGGCLSSANLTNDSSGLARRSDAEIKAMILDGRRPEGTPLHPLMPYWVYHNMKDEDADAIVTYLRRVRGVNHIVKPKGVAFFTREPAAPIDPASIPKATSEAGERGRYLATMAGRCLECHTADAPANAIRPIDMSKPFGGNRAWAAGAVGVKSPPGPEVIYSANITPAGVSGIGLWSIADLERAIKEGKDNNGSGICPPHPRTTYRGLTDEDVSDIATYIFSVPKIDKFTAGNCAAE